HRERAVEAGIAAGDADALIGLDALARALDHLDVHPQRIAGSEVGDGPLACQLLDLLLLELLDDVHGFDLSRLLEAKFSRPAASARAVRPAIARWRRHRSGRRSRVSRSASARRQAATLA